MKAVQTSEKGIGVVATKRYPTAGMIVWEELAEVNNKLTGESLAAEIEADCGVEFDASLVGGAENILNSSDKVKQLIFDLGSPRADEFESYLQPDLTNTSIGKYPKKDLATAMAIVQENSFMGASLPVVFPIASRVNHRCVVSNCEATVVDDTIFIITKKEISEGDEITIDYCSQELEDLSSSDRSEKVLSERGFTCLCCYCTSQQPLSSSSIHSINSLEELLQAGLFYKAFSSLQSHIENCVIDNKHYICVKVYRTSREYCTQIGDHEWVIRLCELEIGCLPSCNYLSISRCLVSQGDAVSLLSESDGTRGSDEHWNPPSAPSHLSKENALSVYERARDVMNTVYPSICKTDLLINVQSKIQQTLLKNALRNSS